jgi:hypothetical protein
VFQNIGALATGGVVLSRNRRNAQRPLAGASPLLPHGRDARPLARARLAEEPARVAALQAEIGWLAYVEERIVESGAAPAAGREPDRNMRSSDCAA